MQPGDLIESRYRLLESLGSGGMAHVWRARDMKLGRDVALKVLKQSPVDAERMRFEREAVAAGRLNHPHVAQVYGAGELDTGERFITFEVVDGRPLSAERGRQLPIERVRSLALQLCDVLIAAHDLGVTHRDLKPENIMLDDSDHVKVIDFGIAKIADSQRSDVTKSGELVGTPQYMSPEQLRGRNVGPATDQYALGVILFELLEGALPFNGGMLEVAMAHIGTAPPAISRTDCPPALRRVVARTLEKEASMRYPDARALRNALQQKPRSRRVLPEVSQDRRIPHWVAILTAVSFAVVSLVLGVEFLSNPDEPVSRRLLQPRMNVSAPAAKPPAKAAPRVVSEAPPEVEHLNPPAPEGCAGNEAPTIPISQGFSYVPLTYSPDRKSPILLVLAGANQDPRKFFKDSGLLDLAEDRGLVVAIVADAYADELEGGDVPAQVRAFIDGLVTNLCVDRENVIVAAQRGRSSVADRLACAPWTSAIVMHAHPRRVSLQFACEGGEATPTLAIWPTGSTRQPVAGGEPTCGEYERIPLALEDKRRRTAHGCSNDGEIREFPDGACEYPECDVPYVSCETTGGIYWPDTEVELSTRAFCDPISSSNFPIMRVLREFLDRHVASDREARTRVPAQH